MNKILKISTALVGLIIAAMLISYALSVAALKPLTADSRKQLPGDFITLSDGVLSIEWQGPKDGEKVVLVHGLSTPKFVWDASAKALAAAGYRVLSFDHFGRGFSDRPDVIYNEALYVRELLELLNSQNITQPVTLIGYSMGGGNVVSFAALYPKRVKQLVLIAPAGFVPEYSGTAALVLTPVLGEWLMAMMGESAMKSSIIREVAAGNAPANMEQKFDRQFAFDGYLRAILSTMRHYPMNDLSSAYEQVGKAGIPTQAIWGTEDKVVPLEGSKQILKYIPQMKLHPIEGAAHSLTYARSEQVIHLLLEILKG